MKYILFSFQARPMSEECLAVCEGDQILLLNKTFHKKFVGHSHEQGHLGTCQRILLVCTGCQMQKAHITGCLLQCSDEVTSQ